MQMQELLDAVPDEYQRQFARFIQFGELDADFERAINTSPALQAAVDRALDAQAAQLGPAAAFRAEDMKAPDAQPAGGSPVAAASESLTRAVESAMGLPPDERNRVLDEVRDALIQRDGQAQVAALFHRLTP